MSLSRTLSQARRCEVADLGQGFDDAGGKRCPNGGLVGYRCRRLYRTLSLLDGAFGLLVLHRGHIELELGGGIVVVESLESRQIPFGQGKGRLGLSKRATGLSELAGGGLGLDLEQDLVCGDDNPGAHVELDDRTHRPARNGRLAGGLDDAAELDRLRFGEALDGHHLDRKGIEIGNGSLRFVVAAGRQTEGRESHNNDRENPARVHWESSVEIREAPAT
jgi:hypothetical protein